jgi:hypothetical protein
VLTPANGQLCRYETLLDLLEDKNQTVICHPLLLSPLRLYSTETRFFAHTSGNVHHVFEIQDSIALVDEFEGLQIASITEGYCNRLGAMTSAGEAFIIGKRDVEQLELEDVRLLGIGSNFEIAVCHDDLWVRGFSAFRSS